HLLGELALQMREYSFDCDLLVSWIGPRLSLAAAVAPGVVDHRPGLGPHPLLASAESLLRKLRKVYGIYGLDGKEVVARAVKSSLSLSGLRYAEIANNHGNSHSWIRSQLSWLIKSAIRPYLSVAWDLAELDDRLRANNVTQRERTAIKRDELRKRQ